MRLNILTIYLKEMKEVLRDRKTLIFMVVLPTLVVPVLLNVMIGFLVRAERRIREGEYPHTGSDCISH